MIYWSSKSFGVNDTIKAFRSFIDCAPKLGSKFFYRLTNTDTEVNNIDYNGISGSIDFDYIGDGIRHLSWLACTPMVCRIKRLTESPIKLWSSESGGIGRRAGFRSQWGNP